MPPHLKKIHQPSLSRERYIRPDCLTSTEGDGANWFGGRRTFGQDPNDRN